MVKSDINSYVERSGCEFTVQPDTNFYVDQPAC